MRRLGTFEPFQFTYPGRYWSPDGRNLARLPDFVPVNGRPMASGGSPSIYDPRKTNAHSKHSGCKCHGKCGSCKSGMGSLGYGGGRIYIPRLRGLGDDGSGDGGDGSGGADFTGFMFDDGGGGASPDPGSGSDIPGVDALDFYGVDGDGNPVYIDSQGNVFDQDGNVLTDLSQLTTIGSDSGNNPPQSQQSRGSSGGGGGGSIPSGGGGGGPKSSGGSGGSSQQQLTPQQIFCMQNPRLPACQSSQAQLINSLSSTAGTLLAARHGITPGQFGSQNARVSSSFPTWGWVALGIAGVAAVGIALK